MGYGVHPKKKTTWSFRTMRGTDFGFRFSGFWDALNALYGARGPSMYWYMRILCEFGGFPQLDDCSGLASL